MQRAMNSGFIGDGNVNVQIAQSFNNLTNMLRSKQEILQSQKPIGDEKLDSMKIKYFNYN